MSKSQAQPSRRGFMLGAAAAGAAATAVVSLPKSPVPAEAVVPEAQPLPERGGGYRESPHVQHYYKTTRV